MCPEAWNLSFFFSCLQGMPYQSSPVWIGWIPDKPPPAEAKTFVLAILLEGCRWLTQHDNSNSWKKRQFKGLISGVFRNMWIFKGNPYGILWILWFWTSDFSQVSKRPFNWGKFIHLVSVYGAAKGFLLLVRQWEWWNGRETREDALLPEKNVCLFWGVWRLLDLQKHVSEARGKKDRQDISITSAWEAWQKCLGEPSEWKEHESIYLISNELDVCRICIYDQWSCIFLCIVILEHFKHEIGQATKGIWSSNQNLGICWSYLFSIT